MYSCLVFLNKRTMAWLRKLEETSFELDYETTLKC